MPRFVPVRDNERALSEQNLEGASFIEHRKFDAPFAQRKTLDDKEKTTKRKAACSSSSKKSVRDEDGFAVPDLPGSSSATGVESCNKREDAVEEETRCEVSPRKNLLEEDHFDYKHLQSKRKKTRESNISERRLNNLCDEEHVTTCDEGKKSGPPQPPPNTITTDETFSKESELMQAMGLPVSFCG